MSDLADRLARARGFVRTDWPAEATETALRELGARRRRRARTRVALGAACSALVVLVALVGFARRRPPAVVASRGDTLRFADGSRAVPEGAPSDVRVVAQSASRVLVRVVRGGAAFDVTHDPSRVFRVEAGDVAVQVLGTAFVVERLDAVRVRVAVRSGRVRVFAPGDTQDLAAGQDVTFPPTDATAPSTPVRDPAPTAESPDAGVRPVDWRTDAHAGRYAAALRELDARGGMTTVAPADAPLAADVMRRAGRFVDAQRALERAVDAPRVDLATRVSAAYELGRLFEAHLGAPARAAEAYHHAFELDPHGLLARDARRDECRALRRAGEPERAAACDARAITDAP